MPSINQQAKVALTCLANGNDDQRRKMFSEFATYITRSKDNAPANQGTFCDFEDYMMKPLELWTLCDDSDYGGSIKHLLSAVHCNPARASGGERNHKSAKHGVHSRLRARLGSAKVESGTAIHFNAKQLLRQMQTTRDTGICKWLQQLGATTPLLAAAEDAENVRIDDDDNDDGMDIDDEFNH